MASRAYFMDSIRNIVYGCTTNHLPNLPVQTGNVFLSSLLRCPDNLVLELRRETLVCNQQLLALLDQINHLLLQVRSCLFLQTRKLHVERLFTCANRGFLELPTLCCQYKTPV